MKDAIELPLRIIPLRVKPPSTNDLVEPPSTSNALTGGKQQALGIKEKNPVQIIKHSWMNTVRQSPQRSSNPSMVVRPMFLSHPGGVPDDLAKEGMISERKRIGFEWDGSPGSFERQLEGDGMDLKEAGGRRLCAGSSFGRLDQQLQPSTLKPVIHVRKGVFSPDHLRGSKLRRPSPTAKGKPFLP